MAQRPPDQISKSDARRALTRAYNDGQEAIAAITAMCGSLVRVYEGVLQEEFPRYAPELDDEPEAPRSMRSRRAA